MRSFKMYSNELYHHGIKGMKWGVRKEKAEYAAHRVMAGVRTAGAIVLKAQGDRLGADVHSIAAYQHNRKASELKRKNFNNDFVSYDKQKGKEFERDMNRTKNATGYHAVTHLAAANAAGVAAIGAQLATSALSNRLQKIGKNEAAYTVRSYGRQAVKTLKTTSKAELGLSAINGYIAVHTGSLQRYVNNEKEIRKKYR